LSFFSYVAGPRRSSKGAAVYIDCKSRALDCGRIAM
jgi:hypothetical protein